ncbi:MAG: L,D-transpeptidase family protein [Gemmatimonadota bacterium]|nr:L,D-transpeptidase family protein [Gemmatimonadota bacterium]
MTSRATTALARRTALLFAALSIAAACSKQVSAAKRVAGGKRFHHAAVWSPATLTDVQGVPIADLKIALTKRLAAEPPAGVDKDAWHHTQALYKSLGQTPLWLTSDGVAKDRAKDLTDAVLSVSNDALRPDAYPIVELANALGAVKVAKPTADQLANADVLLSTMYASLGEDLLIGQISPKDVGQAWHINPDQDDVDSALVHSLGDTLARGIAEMRPPEPAYAALQKELARYREIVSKGDFPHVPAGKTLRQGQSDSPSRISALRERLAAEGLTAGGEATAAVTSDSAAPKRARSTASAGGSVYDAGLAEAIGQFQSRHAITVDKTLSPETVNALNVPAAYRLGQIAANLERYRWMPRSLGSRYVLVNVPAFELTAFDSGEKTLEMKVIVGQSYEDKATPVFSDSMETVVFRPYWNITPDIQAKEIAPKIAANPGYMDAENLEYFKDGGATRIRQKPGPKNALGFVKFLFPNEYNIYLHDTPNHDLFNKDVRAFSHGCIRVEKPNELAQWVLGWDAAKVQEAMDNGKDNTSVKLPAKIPVYITYGTAFIRDGQLFFGNDLYHRDDKLVKAAASAALESPAAKAALEQLKKIAAA